MPNHGNRTMPRSKRWNLIVPNPKISRIQIIPKLLMMCTFFESKLTGGHDSITCILFRRIFFEINPEWIQQNVEWNAQQNRNENRNPIERIRNLATAQSWIIYPTITHFRLVYILKFFTLSSRHNHAFYKIQILFFERLHVHTEYIFTSNTTSSLSPHSEFLSSWSQTRFLCMNFYDIKSCINLSQSKNQLRSLLRRGGLLGNLRHLQRSQFDLQSNLLSELIASPHSSLPAN